MEGEPSNIVEISVNFLNQTAPNPLNSIRSSLVPLLGINTNIVVRFMYTVHIKVWIIQDCIIENHYLA